MMEQKHEYAEYLGAKKFSNKRYSIHVKLFRHGMARAKIRYKKRKNLKQVWKGCDFLVFDECRREWVFDTWDCLQFLQMDKSARKWFRKVLHPCIGKYLLPNGSISAKLAEEDENEERQQWCDFMPKDIDVRLFGRDDVLSDERAKGRRLFFHTGADDLSRLEVNPLCPKDARPPLRLHVDKEKLLAIIRAEHPAFYERLRPHGYDDIEAISIYCTPLDVHPERVKGYPVVSYPCPVVYGLPDMEKEEQLVLEWMYRR